MGAAEAPGGPQQDRLGNAVGIFVHFAVPESDHRPAFAFEKRGADLIAGGLEMLAAVDLDDETGPTYQLF